VILDFAEGHLLVAYSVCHLHLATYVYLAQHLRSALAPHTRSHLLILALPEPDVLCFSFTPNSSVSHIDRMFYKTLSLFSMKRQRSFECILATDSRYLSYITVRPLSPSDRGISELIYLWDFTPFNMCDRDIITQEYRNCTNQPKHTVVRYNIRPCKDVGTSACKGTKDNASFGKSSIHGGVCPKC
jgi:hypothetical protein